MSLQPFNSTARAIIEFPNGEKHHFLRTLWGDCRAADQCWKLVKIRDQYDQGVDFKYEQGFGSSPPWSIEINDTDGRKHEVDYDLLTASANDEGAYRIAIDEVVINQHADSQHEFVVDFNYGEGGSSVNLPLLTNLKREYPHAWGDDPEIKVPLLRKLFFPEGLVYEFDYNIPTGNQENKDSGTLTQYTLPTGASIEFEYGDYELPKSCNLVLNQDGIGGVPRHNNSPKFAIRGVVSKTVTDPFAGMNANGSRSSVSAMTEYDVALQSEPSGMPGATSCSRPNWYRTDTLEPEGSNGKRLKRTTYYSIADRDNGAWKAREHGLPIKKDDSLNISEAGGQVYLSEVLSECSSSGGSCTELRKTYLRYALRIDGDAAFCEMGDDRTCSRLDAQIVARHTVYVDDNNSYKGTRFLDYDGLGHMRETQEYASSDFKGDSGLKTSISSYNSNINSNDVVLGTDSISLNNSFYQKLPDTLEPWLLDLIEETTVNGHGGPALKMRYKYNDQGSVLKQSTGDANSNALYTSFKYRADGRIEEQAKCFGED